MVTTLNKKKNYRPVSNLPFLSKVLEKVVLHQLRGHLLANNLSEIFQSAYRAHHSTETALLDVTNRLLDSADEGRVSILTLLDLSAAFDTLDHNILLTRLHDMFGISSKVFEWFFNRICLIDSSLSASTVGSLNKRRFITGFLKVLSWAQYSLLVYTAIV